MRLCPTPNMQINIELETTKYALNSCESMLQSSMYANNTQVTDIRYRQRYIRGTSSQLATFTAKNTAAKRRSAVMDGDPTSNEQPPRSLRSQVLAQDAIQSYARELCAAQVDNESNNSSSLARTSPAERSGAEQNRISRAISE